MAMTCCKGRGECDGCMDCLPDEKIYKCPYCNKECEYYYTCDGEIMGCDNCIEKVDAAEWEE